MNYIKKRPNGKYKYETSGTLILTTRRLTFSYVDKQGEFWDDRKKNGRKFDY